ncbi:MAG: 50S ribosomal protein L11 methyltransferase [Holosporaceae bacterium]|nr:50S ribosomal protein L11 methyltransferase [Holosporaceae bacterium]
MTTPIHKCTIGDFDFAIAAEVADLPFGEDFMCVSLVEADGRWRVELLRDNPIDEKEILDLLGNHRAAAIKIEKLEQTDWLERCFESFRPIAVDKFYIYGPHRRIMARPPDKICLEIAAATAFGSGEHPTTNRCLVACGTFFDRRRHKNALDLGCGSGVLAIALAKLGGEKVTAADNDPEALRVTGENIVINKVANRVSVFQNQESEFASAEYDFIVSNILACPLIAMAPAICQTISTGGILIISGFTADDSDVPKAYSSLRLIHRYDLDGWSTLVYRKLISF